MTTNDPSRGDASAMDATDGDADTTHHGLWADEVADEIEARDPDEPVVVEDGVSPSGVAHLGNFNEITRGYFVAEVLREHGHEVWQVFISDDEGPLRKPPRKFADADGDIVGLGEVDAGALGRNLDKPYTSIPDPFGEAESYATHFATLLKADADRLGVPVEMTSNTELYDNGDFDPVVGHILGHANTAREMLDEYQLKVDEDYVPFDPVCAEYGKITETVTDIDLDAGTIDYVCTGMTIGGNTIDDCGHGETATFREGKLPWRFRWPGQWQVLGVDLESFGKDHAEGSWPSGKDIAEDVLGIEPPVSMVYEWFTLNGEALSSSAGNIVTVAEMLGLLEPEVLRYSFVLNPRKARDLDLTRLDQFMDDFDRFERAYFGEVDGESLTCFAERAYPFIVDEVREDRVRLPYTFAAVLGMTDDENPRVKMARNEGSFDGDTPDEVVEEALGRVERVRRWAKKVDNQYNYRLQVNLPEFDFEPAVEATFDEPTDFVERNHGGEAIQGEIYEAARRYDIEMGDLFAAGYRLSSDAEQGSRLGGFLGELEHDFVVMRLRRED